MDAPLAGILVADLTQNVAGPTCTQILGDMGADVVKVERRGRGDDARAWAPPYWGEESATFMGVNRSKRSLAVDMKHDEGRAVVGGSSRRPMSSSSRCARAPSRSSAWAGREPTRSIPGSSTARSPPSARKGHSAIAPATTH
jgi:Predicted acyl-CoA transferases/carnitine dehydratase